MAVASKKISVILPALNEENNLEALVQEIVSYFEKKDIPYEIIVVDDGSSDRTGQIAERLSRSNPSVRVIHHERNVGYGRSIADGFSEARGTYLFFTDADRQFRIESLDTLLPVLQRGSVDAIIGYRIDRKDAPIRKLSSLVYNLASRLLLGVKVKDLNCAFKLFHRRIFEQVKINSINFVVNAEILAKADLFGFTVAETGVPHYPRAAGSSTVAFTSVFITLKELFFLYLEMRRLKKRLSSNRPQTSP
jgi:glycosyltransferase involved in cell wall biosynthesis